MVIAADYPFMDVLWTMVIFFCWVVWIWMMIVILSDVFRRRDIGGWSKAAWTFFLIIVPFLAALIYLIVNHDGMAERSAREARVIARGEMAERAAQAGVTGTNGGAADEIRRAKELLDSGAITQAEFEQLKAKALT